MRALLMTAMIAAAWSIWPAAAAEAEDTIDVELDQAQLIRLESPAAEIVVGNPSIADVAVQSAEVLVVTGKSFGRTNLLVLDAKGSIIKNAQLSVNDPGTSMITVHRGASSAATVYCAPRCTAPLAIGDEAAYFESVQKQISAKQGLAQGSAEGGAGGQ